MKKPSGSQTKITNYTSISRTNVDTIIVSSQLLFVNFAIKSILYLSALASTMFLLGISYQLNIRRKGRQIDKLESK